MRWLTLVVFVFAFGAIAETGSIEGKVVSIDPSYGNLDTDVPRTVVEAAGFELGDRFVFRCGGQEYVGVFVVTYTDVAAGNWIGLVNGEDNLQIAIAFGSATEASGCVAGDAFSVDALSPPEAA